MYNYENPTQVEFENEEGYGYASGSLQGSIEASFAQLECAIGKPDYEGIGDNITTQFVVKARFYNNNDDDFESIKFTLYDWGYARNLNDPYEKTTWNVGGSGYSSYEAAELFVKIMNDDRYLEDIMDINFTIDTEIMVEAA